MEAGHTVKLIKPERIKAFQGCRNKIDAADAQAICEALTHPGTTFVEVKTIEQQSFDFLIDRRERLIHDRTELVNQTRTFFAELGLVMLKGIQHFASLFKSLANELRAEFNDRIQSDRTGNRP